jgi:hypothetical protein
MSQPKYIDFYVFGKLPNNFTQPSFLISRNDYPAGAHSLNLTVTVGGSEAACLEIVR